MAFVVREQHRGDKKMFEESEISKHFEKQKNKYSGRLLNKQKTKFEIIF
jgi:hypothetical protein